MSVEVHVAEQVFEIEALMQRVVELLRDRARALSTGMVAAELGVPLWAADRALEAAYVARLASFEAGVGWSALEAAAARVPDGETRNMDLVSEGRS